MPTAAIVTGRVYWMANNHGTKPDPLCGRTEWLDSVCAQVAFEASAPMRPRCDSYFNWPHFTSQRAKAALAPEAREPFSREWLMDHQELLWEARQMLHDGVSRLLYDAHLVLRAVGPFRYRFPRMDFDRWLTIRSRGPFRSSDLPTDYSGLPLEVFDLTVEGGSTPVTVIATEMQVNLCNAFRQYAPIRDGVMLGPRRGDVVLDCGACIGEFSTIFAAMTGPAGAVHLFDPVPLHLRFCALQAAANPLLQHVLRPVHAAVGAAPGRAIGTTGDLTRIKPGGLGVSSYDTVSLDDYVLRHRLDRVDYIKMDIEGAELDAISGASTTIARFRPRLAISTYHRATHLWEIPRAIRRINPHYRLHFAHHAPVRWESVYYATDSTGM
jgi:FkbM family methyltransferase